MQAHYQSWSSQNEFILECGKLVQEAVIKEVKKAIYYSVIVDGTPDASHTEQVTFVMRYVHCGEDNVWDVRSAF